MKRLHVQLWIAVFLSVSGMILLFCGFWVVPTGQIDNSVLVAYGEVSTFAGALFGVDYRYKCKYKKYIQGEDETENKEEKKAMRELVQDICHRHDIIDILGHRDTSPDKNGNGIVEKCEWMKECPCFDVKSEFTSFLPPVIVRP